MQVYAGCAVPEEYLYDVEFNNWARLEDDGTVRLGMTDIAQTLCGEIVAITFRPPGKTVARGKMLAVIESAKWVGPFRAPLTGELVETNETAFEADPRIANRDPYGAGWVARIRPTRLDDERTALSDGLAAFAAYRELIDREKITCMRCAD